MGKVEDEVKDEGRGKGGGRGGGGSYMPARRGRSHGSMDDPAAVSPARQKNGFNL
jgi:hypothetical protein